jgi:exopolysaccharide production protein ExoZ
MSQRTVSSPSGQYKDLDAGAGRSEAIQLMRYVAAGAVLVTHTTFYYHERVDPTLAIWHVGEVGVPIFFVISGVVMVLASAKLPLDHHGAAEFMGRRLLRIVPLYWLVTLLKVLIALAIPAVVLHNHFDLSYALKSFLFIPTFNGEGEVRPIHGVGWTLLHEMFFYVCFALAMLLRMRPLLFVSVAVSALCITGRFFTPESAWAIVVTHPINLCFLVGMAIGGVVHEANVSSRRSQVVLAGLLVAASAKQFGTTATTALLPDVLTLMAGAALLTACCVPVPARLRRLVSLGDSSYALYLFHPLLAPPAVLVIHLLTPRLSAWVTVLLVVVVVTWLAHMIYLFIERPLNLKVKRMFGPRRPAPPLPETVT